LALAFAGNVSAQNCGLSRVDHLVPYSESGAWNPNVYRSLVTVLTVGQIGGALWEGTESRLGRTMWQGIDAELVSAVAAGAGKLAFTRVRPSTEDNPCLWFQGGQNRSFPSGEASVAAALVTPYVLEYAPDSPSAYALLMLPLYVSVGRLKNHAHWQTDVLAGWVVGGASGWYAHEREVPIMIQLLPHGVAVGLKHQF
jgi:membrane-associated phospholipid phosphatase